MAWAQSPPPRDVQLQAALVLKLLNFVDWPAVAIAGTAPLRLCVQPGSALGQALLSSTKPSWRDVPILVVLLDKPDEPCHVLVMEPSRPGVPPPLKMGLLTIGLGDSFVHRGGMIALVRRNNRFSFDVNLDVVKQAQLRLETTLVQLAHTVVYSR